jgi:Mrp family chromosome partitioning ATPase
LETITFYSYKGGTGRTLAVANTAKFLARFANIKVFVLDFDLEAPSLHYKFQFRPNKGLVDLIKQSTKDRKVPALRPYCSKIPFPGYEGLFSNCGKLSPKRTPTDTSSLTMTLNSTTKS